ncbi:hypothetical protein KSP39_PZI004031 [Platanthera zijinensis]|uniref:Uncharacterized protein n=1 Tax=Platanthera zijinensis TaxID=2320716 RepID=A0AAP0BV81_9ASPA
MSFKRMIWSSCRVEPWSTRHEIDLPKKKAFFEQANSFGTLWIHSFSYSKISPLSLCFHVENSLQMKRCQMGLLLPKQILRHLCINAGSSRIRKKSISNC